MLHSRLVTKQNQADNQHYHFLCCSESCVYATTLQNGLLLACRSEEAALVSRQKDIEVASATSRLASTLPTAGKRPLSRVNGESDATTSSSSSSIIQNVWEDVLRLATGAPGQHAANACVLPGGGAGVNTLEAAATMRRKALELIEVWCFVCQSIAMYAIECCMVHVKQECCLQTDHSAAISCCVSLIER
jgi:hypothetical protein